MQYIYDDEFLFSLLIIIDYNCTLIVPSNISYSSLTEFNELQTMSVKIKNNHDTVYIVLLSIQGELSERLRIKT